MKELSKEEAIRLHREMWNWIAEQAEKTLHNGLDYALYGNSIVKLKYEFLYNVKHFSKNEIPANGCFCCEYANQQSANRCYKDTMRCDFCPLIWGTNEAPFCSNNFYSYCVDSPRHIANLPEKEGEYSERRCLK